MDEYHEDLEMSSPFYYLITKSLFFLFLVVPAATVVIVAMKPDITNGHLEFSNYLVLKNIVSANTEMPVMYEMQIASVLLVLRDVSRKCLIDSVLVLKLL